MEEKKPFELLKTYSGLIYRQPLFVIKDRLELFGYHITFLDNDGNALADDAKTPDFVAELPSVLPTIASSSNILLTVPASWQQILSQISESAIDIFVEIQGSETLNSDNSRLKFAYHSDRHKNTQGDMLLIDIHNYDLQSIEEHLAGWGKNFSQLCITNVDNLEQFAFCASKSFVQLEGQFYTLPVITNNQALSPSTQTLLELLVKLQDPEIEPKELADTINKDVTLSYKLIRLINSAFFGLPKEINSTKQAIVMLGNSKIKTWASLLSLSGLDDKPNGIKIIAMVRARMCELLAKYYKGRAETFFAAGLFSTLDALMDKPLESIIDRLPLAPDLIEALLAKTGAAGNALSDVLNYEQANWQAINVSHLPTEILARAYLDAIHWAGKLNAQLQD